MFPEDIRGYLDKHVLKSFGMDQTKAVICDALWFFQLLWPLCDPKMSGIENDKRKAFFTLVAIFTNAYVALSGCGAGYGHRWESVTPQDIVRYFAILIWDGVLGGSHGALYQRWDPNSPKYSPDIVAAMSLSRFGEIKRFIKLCNNDKGRKRGEPGYDPAYKFDLPYRVLVDNTNTITAKADENLTIDETSWPHCGYGEAQSGICGRLSQNKKIVKCGQTVICIDACEYVRPRAYIHRHKLYNKKAEGFTQTGPYEFAQLLKQVEEMCEDSDVTSDKKKIFAKCPMFTADNFFCSEQ